MTERIDLPSMDADTLEHLAYLDALAALDPNGQPASWEPGGAMFEILADLIYARAGRLKPAAEAAYEAGLGP